MADQTHPDVTPAAIPATPAPVELPKSRGFSFRCCSCECGKGGSRLARYLGSTGFSFALICFVICFVYYLLLSGWEKLSIDPNSFLFRLFGVDEKISDLNDATKMLSNMYTALWVMGISAVSCFITGFLGSASCRISGISIALISGVASLLGAAAFLAATWIGFDCWYLGAVPAALYGLGGLFAIISALR